MRSAFIVTRTAQPEGQMPQLPATTRRRGEEGPFMEGIMITPNRQKGNQST
jgi:hypothetical protein